MDEYPRPPADPLDTDYVHILRQMKPFITCIINNQDIEMIQQWLERLSEDANDKKTRNAYLLLMFKQIKNGQLEKPFLQPPSEPLDPTVLYNVPVTIDNLRVHELPVTPKRSKTFEVSTKRSRKRLRRGTYTRCFEQCSRRTSCTADEKSCDTESSWLDLSDDAETVGDGASGDAYMHYQETFTDAPQAALYKDKINNLVNVIDHLQCENAALNDIVDNYNKPSNIPNMCGIAGEIEMLKGRELLDMKTALQTSHMSIAEEWKNSMKSLQKKLRSQQKKNGELKKVITDLEHGIQNLHSKASNGKQTSALLTEMHNKEIDHLNQRHQDELTNLQKELAEKASRQAEDFNKKYEELKILYENRLSELQSENLSKLRVFYEKQVEEVKKELEEEMSKFCSRKEIEILAEKEIEVERAYKQKIESLENDRESIKEEYENKLEEQKSLLQKEIDYKDSEIQRVESLLKQQCERMQVEVETIKTQIEEGTNADVGSQEKIEYLQKCIMKMNKLYRKAEHEFNKQLIKLRREMEMKEKHHQIVLSTQRVQLISNTSMAKQKEIDEIVQNLEGTYKQLLVEQQNLSIRDKRQDSKVIADLRTELMQLKTGII